MLPRRNIVVKVVDNVSPFQIHWLPRDWESILTEDSNLTVNEKITILYRGAVKIDSNISIKNTIQWTIHSKSKTIQMKTILTLKVEQFRLTKSPGR